MNSVFLSIGSNLNNRYLNINKSIKYLKKQCNLLDSSFMYETKPMYNENQDHFLNTVVKIETKLDPFSLLKFIKQIEKDLGNFSQLGRKETFQRNQPRPIDIDILFFNQDLIDSEDLQIPHKRIEEREFVLTPFMDIDSHFKNPRTQNHLKNSLNLLQNLGNDENIYQVFGIKDKIYKLKGHTLTMGVFNATPDSFYLNTNHTMNQSFYEKCDVIDIGGESTRPGAKEVSLDQEIERVEKYLDTFTGMDKIISLDTRKSQMVQHFSDRIHIINDVSGGNFDHNMLATVENSSLPYILQHSRGNLIIEGTPESMKNLQNYVNCAKEVKNELIRNLQQCQKVQIPRWNILIDPGIGFAKNQFHNIEIIKNLELFTHMRYPVLIGFSNKKFISYLLLAINTHNLFFLISRELF